MKLHPKQCFITLYTLAGSYYTNRYPSLFIQLCLPSFLPKSEIESYLVPFPVAAPLVHRVKSPTLYQTLSETQGHASVIRPLGRKGGREGGEQVMGLEADTPTLTCPGRRRNFPPPTMSVIGSNEPRGMVSTVVPRASPTARPRRLPRKRSRTSIAQ